MALTLPIAAAVVLLLVIVTLSNRQTIFAYPNGGGSYVVARQNLGTPFVWGGKRHQRRRRHQRRLGGSGRC